MERSRFTSAFLRTLVLLTVILGINGFGQTSRGTVSGTVFDKTGAVVVGAKVELKNNGTGVIRTSQTNEAGIYRFDAVDLGSYSLKIDMNGFKQSSVTDIGIEANRTATIDVTLEVGVGGETVEVSATTEELLIRDSPIRGGSISSKEVITLPVAGLEPLSLARTLPGVVQAVGSSTFGNGGQNTQFSVNGQRPRGNNYLLDGVENNDISIGGNAQSFNITDAVQEVSVQTSNFGSEFGRGGGGVFNIITKSGTSQYHGTALWQYRSQVFNSVSNTDKLNNNPKDVFNQNIFGFTLGGPIIKNKTFAFGGLQKDMRRSTGSFDFVVPTVDAVSRLRTLFPNNSRLDLYLNAVGDLRGTANSTPIKLGADPATGVDRGSVTFATANISMPAPDDDIQWITRIDHNLTDSHRLAFRYVYDSSVSSPDDVVFPGYVQDFNGRSQNFQLSDTYTFSPTWTNEFRFSYGRIGFNFPISERSIDLAQTMPNFSFATVVAGPGIATNIPQFRYANNWALQETQTKLSGHHTFRYGAELLWQLARQRPPFNERGSYTYTNSGDAYSAFANFLDDFSGPSGSSNRNFGDSVYYPNLFRHSYFFQDTWKVIPSLSLTLGLRYENFGQPANGAFDFPAFAGYDPAQFRVPNKVNPDNNNFGPSIGLVWSPSYKSGLLHRLFGEGKTVWRAGYQISYDTFFNNLLSNIAADSPNSLSTTFNGLGMNINPRGSANFFASLPQTARTPVPTDQQTAALDKNIRNPYTERWSLGIQRELPNKLLLEVSYVGTGSHKLFTSSDVNPRLLNGQRLYPNLGIRRIRASEGNAIYHAMQVQLERRFANSFQVTGAYTFSKNIDSTSEVFATNNSVSSNTSIPTLMGGLSLDRGLSDYHRAHRFTLTYVWEVPGPKKGILKHPFGGWSISGITTFQSGTPYSVANGSGADRNNDGLNNDRPDISNPNAPINTRAVISTGKNACATGYSNPDTLACVTPADVHWIQGVGMPNGSTVGRNTLTTPGFNNFDVNILKTFSITESKKLEYRVEAFNFFNHPQFVNVPGASVLATQQSRFLNLDYTNSCVGAGCAPRTMRMQLKFLF
jgi:outer membrane receptor protein involved in Fe transport